MVTLIRRTAPLLVGAALLVLATLALTSGVAARIPFPGAGAVLVGTNLGGHPAPDFQLPDAHGKVVRLQDFRGKTVALTFIYTDCPDVCPLIAQKFRVARGQLGSDVNRVALVAITVDPETDTPGRIAAYTEAMGMTGRWWFLTGSRQELQPIWAAYGVAPVPVAQARLLEKSVTANRTPTAAFAGIHTAGVYLIGPDGNERRLLDPDFRVADLVGDLRQLAAEG